MIDSISIIRQFYIPGSRLYELLMTHSDCVARKAMQSLRHAGIQADCDFVFEAAMMHDIGIIRTHAPAIWCQGERPYICHGIEGRGMLEVLGLPRHALVCERHTGAGLTVDDIVRQDLPLPRRDMTPQSTEEMVICYADKFFSKSRTPRLEIPLEHVISSMARHGQDTLERFMTLHRMFHMPPPMEL